ncbi:RbsD/FucU domain-containing protein [Brachybacterium sp. UNK5269]|uniref:RbsD/FucU domain-containing protein n=1 Tax=Brachybacterium sp. UNK5269 TaxID=3408576 RepID=UPI003BB1A2D0
MRRGGILHPQLSEQLARLGHTDTFVIGDCGLPIPPGVPRVDLAVVMGVPGFAEVADAILAGGGRGGPPRRGGVLKGPRPSG